MAHLAFPRTSLAFLICYGVIVITWLIVEIVSFQRDRKTLGITKYNRNFFVYLFAGENFFSMWCSWIIVLCLIWNVFRLILTLIYGWAPVS